MINDPRLHRQVTKHPYERLLGELERAFESSKLPEQARGAEALNNLLVRVRMGRQEGG